MNSGQPVIAVINSTPDIIDMLRLAIESAGFVVVTALTFEVRDGEIDLDRFIAQHEPIVIVYDIAPPYETNWRLFEHLSAMPMMRGRQFVLTSTNARHVTALAGRYFRRWIGGITGDCLGAANQVAECAVYLVLAMNPHVLPLR